MSVDATTEAAAPGAKRIDLDPQKCSFRWAALHHRRFVESGGTRRSHRHLEVLDRALLEIVESFHPMTVRQVFYQASSREVISKSEHDYKLVVRRISQLRADGTLSYDRIVDSTRLMRKPDSYSDLAEALEATRGFHRKAHWAEQHVRVEVWSEKDTLSGTLFPVTSKWDVPLMVTRGFSSTTFIEASAVQFNEVGKPTVIILAGDLDPSGVSIRDTTERKLRQFASVDIESVNLAVTREQVEELKLPTRPTKKSDSRSKNFDGESTEADSIRPDVLRELLDREISSYVDADQLERTMEIEKAERETLGKLVAGFGS